MLSQTNRIALPLHCFNRSDNCYGLNVQANRFVKKAAYNCKPSVKRIIAIILYWYCYSAQ